MRSAMRWAAGGAGLLLAACGGGQAANDGGVGAQGGEGLPGFPGLPGLPAAPTASDAIKNGAETDVDCGGPAAPPCADDAACNTGTDCGSKVCSAGRCAAATAKDGVQNGAETDVDCGGEGAPACEPGARCGAAGDCSSKVCSGGVCAAPRPDDAVVNGDETDVDCGGTAAPKCAAGKACKAHGDCTTDGCDYNGRCALARSCTAHEGGDTCGAGETGDPAARHESCCASLPVPRPAAQGGAYVLDKYMITAGRMRAFVERTDGNLRAFAATNPPGWNTAWTARLPATKQDTLAALGPFEADRRGCWMQQGGARTYWQEAHPGFPQDHTFQRYGREILDEKALNCVSTYLLAAFCAWDGGRLASADEVICAVRGTDNRRFPWGNTPDLENARTHSSWRAMKNGAYVWPRTALDNTAYMPAPGRFPLNTGPFGHMDLAGLFLHFTPTPRGNGEITMVWTGSVEGHAGDLTQDGRSPETAYWMNGGRCAR